MSEEKPPSRPFISKIFDKFFPKTLKTKSQLMQALEEAEENLVIDPHSRSVIEGALLDFDTLNFMFFSVYR